jgi:aryl-alcohol dehydrogenase-like predicted oxidoreductase
MTSGVRVSQVLPTFGASSLDAAPAIALATSPDLPTPAPLAAPAPRRRLGQSDLRVFPLAIGGNVFGWTADSGATDNILDAYRDHGGNFIDTADSYAGGRSEIMIGGWMRSRRNRHDMVVATKVGKSADSPGVTARAITRAVNSSLERLGTDYIDLLYLHIDDESVPFEETLFAVDALIRSGKVRYFGASDHSGNRLVEARVIAAQLGVIPMVAVQNHYNLVHRSEFEGDLARAAHQQRLAVMPRFALASGFLTGKYRSRSDLVRNERGGEAARYLTKRGLRILSALDAIVADQKAAGFSEASVASVSLAWLLTKPDVVAPVASASHAEQVPDLVAAAMMRLTRHQIADLDRASD